MMIMRMVALPRNKASTLLCESPGVCKRGIHKSTRKHCLRLLDRVVWIGLVLHDRIVATMMNRCGYFWLVVLLHVLRAADVAIELRMSSVKCVER
jgi:hypothetical protein